MISDNIVIDTAGIAAFVKLAVDILKLAKPDGSSTLIIATSLALSIILSALSVIRVDGVVDTSAVYAVITQSIIVVAVAVGLTEVQKSAESRRRNSGDPDRKIG